MALYHFSVDQIRRSEGQDGSRGKSNETKLKQARKRYDEVTRLFDRTETEDGVNQTVKICYRFGGYIGERTFKAKMLRNSCKKKNCPRKKEMAK